MSDTTTETVIEITAVRNAADLSVQVILPADVATVEAAVRQQNPDLDDRRVNMTVRSLTDGALSMARATGSNGCQYIDRGVHVHLKCAPHIAPTLANGTEVSYRGEPTSTVVARHPETFEYTVLTQGGQRFRAGTEWFLTV